MKKFWLTCLLLLISSGAAALDVTIPIGSYHFDRDKNWNESNTGIGLVYKDYTAGYYKNSYYKDTFYVGYRWRPLSWGEHVKAGLTVALATGYDSPLLVIPTLSIESKVVSTDFIFAPTLGKASGFVGMQLRFTIADDL